MKKLRIHLDTSVISFLFADDAPAYRDLTREFFDVHLPRFDVIISDIVIFEIDQTSNLARRALLLAAVRQHGLRVVEPDAGTAMAIETLADCYVNEGAIPVSKRQDAMHVAMAVVLGADILLSWNFRHLANVRRQAKIDKVNKSHAYSGSLAILTPLEVMGDETGD